MIFRKTILANYEGTVPFPFSAKSKRGIIIIKKKSKRNRDLNRPKLKLIRNFWRQHPWLLYNSHRNCPSISRTERDGSSMSSIWDQLCESYYLLTLFLLLPINFPEFGLTWFNPNKKPLVLTRPPSLELSLNIYNPAGTWPLVCQAQRPNRLAWLAGIINPDESILTSGVHSLVMQISSWLSSVKNRHRLLRLNRDSLPIYGPRINGYDIILNQCRRMVVT